MTKLKEKQKNLSLILCTAIGFLSMLCMAFFGEINHYLSGLYLCFLGFILYFIITIFAADKNWLDARSVFSGVWFVTIGLASLRLTGYQEVWQNKTWIILALAFLVFQFGTALSCMYSNKVLVATESVFKKIKTGRLGFEFRENRLFLVALIATLIGVVCFIASVVIKGFIPCFSNDPFAYVNFYTKFHIFSVASTMSAGLCYYCIKTQPIGIVKKIILWLCIFYQTILFPVLIVSRGVFITAAITFTSVVFYLNKKRFIAFFLCVICMAGIYMYTSNLRNFSDENLEVLFEPIEVNPENPNEDDKNNQDNNLDTNDDNNGPFVLSPKIAFLYGYLTVGHDNFNEAVENLTDYTYGTRTLTPFNVILRSNTFAKLSSSVENHFVRPHLNTNNILGTGYYDFHIFGSLIFIFVWSFIVMTLQKCYENRGGPFLLLLMSNTVQIFALSFFENFTARFEFWVFWGVVLIFAIVSSIYIKPKEN